MYYVALIILIMDWVIPLWMLIYVPQKKSPAAARTWLILIFLFPFAGLFLYLYFGRVYVPRLRMKMHNKASERIEVAQAQFGTYLLDTRVNLPEECRHVAALTQKMGDLDAVGGNRLELIDDYNAALERLVADIDAAQHHVHLLYYIFANDSAGRQVADALLRAAGRGLQCRVLLDYLGSHGSLKTLGAELSSAAIEVIPLLPVGPFRKNAARFDLRNHRKIAVLDGRVGYIGSQNIVRADFKRGLVFEELVVRAEGPIVTQFQVTLLADRYYETETVISGEGLYSPDWEAGSTIAQLLPSGPGYGRASVQQLLVALMYRARSRVVITTPYFIPDEPLLEAIETAVLRGVEVHLILSRDRDQILVGFAQQSFYEQLLAMGVRIHLYQPHFLHAKHLTIDDSFAIVGSSNMDIRSFALNNEASLLVYDRDFVKRLQAIQGRYISNSKILTPEEWDRRPLGTKAFQSVSRLLDSLL